VQHERFGIGTILQMEGSAPNQKVTVEFINSGKRQLLLKFAKQRRLRLERSLRNNNIT
jgi:DNA helicase-2/ATP-dependent DNA helicase PcrA